MEPRATEAATAREWATRWDGTLATSAVHVTAKSALARKAVVAGDIAVYVRVLRNTEARRAQATSNRTHK